MMSQYDWGMANDVTFSVASRQEAPARWDLPETDDNSAQPTVTADYAILIGAPSGGGVVIEGSLDELQQWIHSACSHVSLVLAGYSRKEE